MINLDKLSKRVDQALEAETKDSLTKWLLNKRKIEANDFYKDLKKYFNNTSKEQVLKDWAKSSELDKIKCNYIKNKRNMEDNNDYEEIHLNKTTHTQDEIKKAITAKIYGCVNKISEIQEKKGIPINGLTSYVAAIGIDGRKYDMTLVLTPDGVFSDFEKITTLL